MSEEPESPPLRLRPRLPAQNSDTPPPPPEPSAAEPPPPSEASRFRLRPKARSEFIPPPAAPPPPPVSLPVDEPAPPPISIPPPVNVRVPPPVVVPPPPPRFVPPPPVAPVAAPTPFHAPRDMPAPSYTPTAKTTEAPVYKADKWLVSAVMVVIVCVGGYYLYGYLTRPKPPKPVVATAPAAETPAPAQTPKAEPKSAAGRALAKTREVVASREQNAAALDAVTADSATAPRHSAAASTATSGPAASSASAPQAPQDQPPLPPTEEFKTFVTSLRVSGVFQGENARALLNGKLYNLGEVVDAKLEITLFKIDAEQKQLVFRDSSGAIVSRRY